MMSGSKHQEKQAADTAPLPLPRHQGDVRYQLALDGDRSYGRLVASALILACFAGSGFGMFATDRGMLLTALWALTVASFVVRCISPRAAWEQGAVAPEVLRLVLRRIALWMLGCMVLSSLSRGLIGLSVAGMALVLGAVLWIFASLARWIAPVSILLLLALGGGLGYSIVQPDTPVETVGICGLGMFAAAALAISSRAGHGPVNFVLALSRLVALAWAGLAAASGSGWPVLGLAATSVLALDFYTIRRTHFAAVVAAVAFVHFGGLLQLPEASIRTRLWFEIPALAIEYMLLILAGFRHVQARVYCLSSATYRIAPLCIVPRLDRAWDYPVKINVS